MAGRIEDYRKTLRRHRVLRLVLPGCTAEEAAKFSMMSGLVTASPYAD